MEYEVLSIQTPALCPLGCIICRTPEHNQGNPEKVFNLANEFSGKYKEVYITSNGETGLSPVFPQLVQMCQDKGIDVSVLCATKASIVPGLKRVEISLNAGTAKTAPAAIEKAKKLGIPFVISMVDDGTQTVDPEIVAEEHGASGVLVRALQNEGRSKKSAGRTQVYQVPGTDLGKFPVSCYAELAGMGYASDCIDHNGNLVPLLGGITAQHNIKSESPD